MITIVDLQSVLCLLFTRSWLLRKEFPDELKEMSLADILQHLYGVIVFGITQQSLPFGHYTGIPVLDQIVIDDIFQPGEKSLFMQRSSGHLGLQGVTVSDCLIVGMYGVIAIDPKENVPEIPTGIWEY